jgi:hypothetical protein
LPSSPVLALHSHSDVGIAFDPENQTVPSLPFASFRISMHFNERMRRRGKEGMKKEEREEFRRCYENTRISVEIHDQSDEPQLEAAS